MSTETLSPNNVNDVVIIPEFALTETPEPTPAEMKATISRLEAEIAANKLRGKQEKVLTDDGTIKTVDQSSKEIKAEIEGWYLTVEQSKRQREEIEARNPIPFASPDGGIQYRSQFATDKPLFPEAADAEALLGRTRFAAMTPQQRAVVRDIRGSDVAKLNPSDYFGKGSSSLKASELGKSNPGLYAALKLRAVKEGIF
ncbi:MAG TPA: hypothetical protein VGU67_04195 [Edaphobacter sp.]|nr:hypothetical protein [Edaphobacter sp.]